MPSPWKPPDRDPAVARLLRRRPVETTGERSLLRDPARALVVVGAWVTILASPLPWLVRVGNPPPQTVTGWSGLADGFFLAVIGATLVVLVLSRSVAQSHSLLVRSLPLILAAVTAAFAVGAVRTMDNRIRIWETEGATGVHQPWLWVCLAGATVCALGAALVGLREVRDPARPHGPIRVSRATVGWALLGGAGAITGGGVVAAIILNSGLDPVAMSLPLLIGVMVGAIAGGNAGARLAHSLVARRGPTDGAPLDRVVPSSVRAGPGAGSRRDRGIG